MAEYIQECIIVWCEYKAHVLEINLFLKYLLVKHSGIFSFIRLFSLRDKCIKDGYGETGQVFFLSTVTCYQAYRNLFDTFLSYPSSSCYTLIKSFLGVPQGSTGGPLLFNIYHWQSSTAWIFFFFWVLTIIYLLMTPNSIVVASFVIHITMSACLYTQSNVTTLIAFTIYGCLQFVTDITVSTLSPSRKY